jgi:hypothetical protein
MSPYHFEYSRKKELQTMAKQTVFRSRKSLSVRILIVLVMIVGMLPISSAGAQTANLALNKPVTCSSIENAGLPCASAVDGNLGTRWSSAHGVDPQWIYVDLGQSYTISQVILRWEAAYATAFQIQTSSNASTWTTIYSTTTGTGGIQTLNVSGSGRYVRMYGTARATIYGYSLWEFEVYGSSGATNTPTRTSTPTATSAQQVGHILLQRERRHHAEPGRGRQCWHTLVQRLQRSAMDLCGPRFNPEHLPRQVELGSSLRQVLSNPNITQCHHLDKHLFDDHRRRRD